MTWRITDSTATSVLVADFTATVPGVRVVPAATFPHVPWRSRTCADADRAADEQIDWLLETLHSPCPHCGQRRHPDD